MAAEKPQDFDVDQLFNTKEEENTATVAPTSDANSNNTATTNDSGEVPSNAGKTGLTPRNINPNNEDRERRVEVIQSI